VAEKEELVEVINAKDEQIMALNSTIKELKKKIIEMKKERAEIATRVYDRIFARIGSFMRRKGLDTEKLDFSDEYNDAILECSLHQIYDLIVEKEKDSSG
jgi:hypothetical protein